MTQREDFVRCAREQVGKRYAWATAGPNTFDCSGLSAFCWNSATGLTISRSSEAQNQLGSPITGPKLIPGDLVFWGNNYDSADHVGIYVGEGRVINALNEEKGVVNSPLQGEYGLPYLGPRRLTFPDEPPFLPSSSTLEDKPAPIKEKHPKARRRRRNRRKAAA